MIWPFAGATCGRCGGRVVYIEYCDGDPAETVCSSWEHVDPDPDWSHLVTPIIPGGPS